MSTTKLYDGVINDLYEGAVRLRLRQDKHWYSVCGSNLLVPDDGKFHYTPANTAITKLLDKPNLLPWAVDCAAKEIHKELIQRVGAEGTIGVPAVLTVVERAKSAHKRERDAAGIVGKAMHAWAELFISSLIDGTSPPADLTHAKGKTFCEKFKQWVSTCGIKWLTTEQMVYSRKYNFAGTVDLVGERGNEMIVVDLKTGNHLGPRHIYDEYFLQTAGYVLALNEEFGLNIRRRIIVRIGRDNGHVIPYDLDELEADRAKKYNRRTYTIDDDVQAFSGLRIAYARLKDC